MKRTFILFVLLLAGLLINVTVASLCDARIDSFQADKPVSPGKWCLSQLDADGKPEGYECSYWGYTARCFASSTGNIERYAGEIETGWPLRSFQGRTAFVFDNASGHILMHTTQAIITGVEPAWIIRDSNDMHLRVLLSPIWTGLIANTTLYAALVWAAFRLIMKAGALIVGSIRRRRNLCPTCAYSLSDLPLSTTSCPECGKPLRLPTTIVPPGGSPLTPTAANDPAS